MTGNKTGKKSTVMAEFAFMHGAGTGSFSRRIRERCIVLSVGCTTWFPGRCACPAALAQERWNLGDAADWNHEGRERRED